MRASQLGVSQRPVGDWPRSEPRMSDRGPSRICPLCRTSTANLHCERDGTGTFQVDNIDVVGASRLNPGDLVGGRYRVVKRIGRGGMGAVYEAEHTGSGQRAAVKVLALEPDISGDPEVFFRFFREARITASLKHPNTVRLYDFGQNDNGPLFMAMELLHGPTLQQLVARRVAQGLSLTAAETVAIATPILRSLREAHQAGLVHRDLKPDNILLAEQGEDDVVVKVLDFGIARTNESRNTKASHLIGTPAFMSPEQCLGTELDGRSDLYALGVVMFYCLTGVTPFRGDAVAQIRGHCDGVPPSVESLSKTPLPQALAQVVNRALAKSPSARFTDAREMREALEAAVPERPAVSRSWVMTAPTSEIDAIKGGEASEEIEYAPTIAAASPGMFQAHSPGTDGTHADAPRQLAPPLEQGPAPVQGLGPTIPRLQPKQASVTEPPPAPEPASAGDDAVPTKLTTRPTSLWPLAIAAVLAIAAGLLWSRSQPPETSAASAKPAQSVTKVPAAPVAVAPPTAAPPLAASPAAEVAPAGPPTLPAAASRATGAPIEASPDDAAEVADPLRAPSDSVTPSPARPTARPVRPSIRKPTRPTGQPNIEEIR